MVQRFLLGLIVGSATIIGVAYLAAFRPDGAPAWAPWLHALGTATILVATTALGALRGGPTRVPALITALLVTGVIVFGGFALALSMTDGAAAALWLGLPRRAAIIMYGVGLLPLFILPVAYAFTFDRATLSPEDWQRVRDAARQLRAEDVTSERELQPRA